MGATLLSDCAHKIYRAVLSLLLGIVFNTYFLISWLLSLDYQNMNTTKPDQHPHSKEVKAVGYAAHDPSGVLSPFKFTRRATGESDVQFKVLYCGICHSDLNGIKHKPGGAAQYPKLPGHEIVGEVTEVGTNVTKVSIGDKVGVGCIVNSCRNCDSCVDELEQYCRGVCYTYNSRLPDGSQTYGGYSNIMVADEHFIIRWPENFPLDRGAPLLCAGVTLYSPLKYYGLDKPGQRIGIVGLGGLGHVGVKFGKAFGAKVTVISTSASKKKEAIERIGADEFIVSSEPDEMQAAAGTLDGIIDTVSAPHAVQPLLSLLKTNGKLVLVGLPDKPLEVPAFSVVMGRKMLGGSMIGGMKETQEMIDFAAKHNILPEVEMVAMDYVNTAMERLAKNDVKYRFVIDVGKTLKAD